MWEAQFSIGSKSSAFLLGQRWNSFSTMISFSRFTRVSQMDEGIQNVVEPFVAEIRSLASLGQELQGIVNDSDALYSLIARINQALE
jgi:hypothetical protein